MFGNKSRKDHPDADRFDGDDGTGVDTGRVGGTTVIDDDRDRNDRDHRVGDHGAHDTGEAIDGLSLEH